MKKVVANATLAGLVSASRVEGIQLKNGRGNPPVLMGPGFQKDAWRKAANPQKP